MLDIKSDIKHLPELTGKPSAGPPPMTKLKLSIGYNKSDNTHGRKGSQNSFTVFYMHFPLEHAFSQVGNSHALLPEVSPLVSFQVRSMLYLGLPFTDCNRTKRYTQSYCLFTSLQRHVASICNCVPEFIPQVREIVGDPNIKGCNFFEFATCVSYVYDNFDVAMVRCLPGCVESGYEQSKIQVFQNFSTSV